MRFCFAGCGDAAIGRSLRFSVILCLTRLFFTISEVSIRHYIGAIACMGCGDATIGCSFRAPDISTNNVRRLNLRICSGMRRCSNRLRLRHPGVRICSARLLRPLPRCHKPPEMLDSDSSRHVTVFGPWATSCL